ncbi:MAG: enoyl-CoA hydratase/isomerase family protein [Balneolia bacterium]|nr:enoyl-CoA hydratase/isomerase family protein [Balneolia bacterium]
MSSKSSNASAKNNSIRKATIIGAGVMGAQIAAHLANAGLQVLLLDRAGEVNDPDSIVNKAFSSMLKMKPSPVVHDRIKSRITTGNLDDDLHRISAVDWIIEVIIEQMDAKKELMKRIEEHAAPHAIISSNTSGLPIHQIVSERSADFRKRFLGTHFFNPPRYLRLLELIPTKDTSPDILEKVRRFGRVHLGKGVVIAKDRPNFIANRIGTYSMMLAVKALNDGYTIEEIDALTGPVTGRPKSATFRTADVVGLDTLSYVSKNLYGAIPDDPDREVFRVPDVLKKLVEKGHLGSKSKKGFYVKEKGEIKSLRPESMEYESRKRPDLGDLEAVQKTSSLTERWKMLYDDASRAGDFIREHTTRLIAYSINRVPEVSDYPYDVDRAIQWGFGWKMGPFAILDAIGVKRFMKEAKKLELELPDWFDEFRKLAKENDSGIYGSDKLGNLTHYVPGSGYEQAPVRHDEITVAAIKGKDGRNEIWNNKEAGLLEMGDGVLLYEFRSKANTLGFNVINGLFEAIDIMEKGDYRGMVIGNDGENFSVGANLGELAVAAEQGDYKMIGKAVSNFQKAALAIRYANKPVVLAMRGKALGGGCELTMGAAGVVASTETYMGLVELGVGLIPAGSGTMTLVARAGERAASQHPSQIQPFLQNVFETIAMAKVATSAHEAIDLGYLTPERTRIAMNEDRRMYMAKEEVIRLSNQGYLPPPPRTEIFVPGAPGLAPLENMAWQMKESGWISEYDAYLASRLAWVMCGGSLTGPQRVHEDYMIELEHEVFLSLLGQQKTRDRIQSILTTNKPLRN